MASALDGIRILEMGHAVAGPFAASLLADFGAEVIKVEQPGVGDSLRRMGPRIDGNSIWWSVGGRNKHSVTIDFKAPAGRELVLRLVGSCDAVVENYRPGVLERARLGWEELSAVNPRLVMLRVSGFGQTGPYSARGGFGKIAEAFSGATELTGNRGQAPLHPGYSLADATSGLMGAYGLMLALFERERSGEGQVIDLALYEPLLRMIEWQLPFAETQGHEPSRNGNQFPFNEAFITDICATGDGGSVVVSAATSTSIASLQALLVTAGQLPATETSSTATVFALRRWCAERDQATATKELQANNVVAGGVNTASQIIADEHVQARGSVVRVPTTRGDRSMPAALPMLSRTPGAVRWPGPELGEHTDDVLARCLDLTVAQLAQLRDDGVTQQLTARSHQHPPTTRRTT
ncbi:CaiB/BaiF CoA transferase family protein [Pseudonocardia acidicola]|uniref:CoA transferase n=1 Tax=Pseudonocardia acidicola TaxID=2724939 RepID=A0ABX1SI04_9PSEU|nr:CoA transferase [Pseudonocardia acidicola]NMI00114.1 CoA transferase [Pseudonocardia acidicola]